MSEKDVNVVNEFKDYLRLLKGMKYKYPNDTISCLTSHKKALEAVHDSENAGLAESLIDTLKAPASRGRNTHIDSLLEHIIIS